MSYPFSKLGQNLATHSGIQELMDDLGNALSQPQNPIKMLGGGQPAHIPAIETVWKQQLEILTQQPDGLAKIMTNYDGPRGNPEFLTAVANLFHHSQGWPITPNNIAVTAGGQTAFFFLFNLLAGEMPDGSHKKILLPLAPEYIGYADQSTTHKHLFHSIPPKIEHFGPHEFKYRVDFENLHIDNSIAAICVSRPTNPTGNVLTNQEISQLASLAKQHNIPLIIDNAYGAPFPNIIFNNDATPYWDDNVILTYSLSKLGLPGTRTGIVIAPPPIAQAISSMSAICGLANPNLGQQITLPIIHSQEILTLAQQIIQPFYLEKSTHAISLLTKALGTSFPWHYHRSEGAIFLWLWFPKLPITSKQLYQRLKSLGVLIVPGEYFFFGLPNHYQSWPHRHQCIRISYAMPPETLETAFEILAQELSEIHKISYTK